MMFQEVIADCRRCRDTQTILLINTEKMPERVPAAHAVRNDEYHKFMVQKELEGHITPETGYLSSIKGIKFAASLAKQADSV